MSSPQREQYQLPDQRGSQQTSYAGGAYGSAVETSAGPQVNYICGECNAKVTLGRGDAIRCKDCGHRVLYKERTKRQNGAVRGKMRNGLGHSGAASTLITDTQQSNGVPDLNLQRKGMNSYEHE